jgi:DNA-binding CsgD family transcriptional regulator
MQRRHSDPRRDALEQWALELLDHNPAAMLLLDGHERVVYANRRARELCAARDGIELAARKVNLARPHDNERLQRLLADARSDPRAGGMLRIARPSGKRSYVAVIAAVVARRRATMAPRPAICIVISDPDGRAPLSSEPLRVAFGLTAAEARLAALLGAGEDLRSAAGEIGITYGTARARLATIFEKTQTRRQGELVKLLLTTAVAWS